MHRIAPIFLCLIPVFTAVAHPAHGQIVEVPAATTHPSAMVAGAATTAPSMAPTTAAVRPGPQNTGPTRPELLVRSASVETERAGQVIENVDIAGRIRIRHDGVTVRNFRVDAGLRTPYAVLIDSGVGDVLLEDGEVVGGTSAGVRGGGFTARRLNVHEAGNDGFKPTGDVLVEHCWVHRLGIKKGAHADGVQIAGGSNFVFRRNHFEMPIGLRGYRSNAAFIIGSRVGPVANVSIEENWLDGGNYTIYVTDPGKGFGPPADVRIVENRFTRNFRYGPLRVSDAEITFVRNWWGDSRWPVER